MNTLLRVYSFVHTFQIDYFPDVSAGMGEVKSNSLVDFSEAYEKAMRDVRVQKQPGIQSAILAAVAARNALQPGRPISPTSATSCDHPATAGASQHCKSSCQVKLEDQEDFEELQKYYVLPEVRTGESAELPDGIRLRKRTRQSRIEQWYPDYHKRYKSAEEEGRHNEMFALLRNLRHKEIHTDHLQSSQSWDDEVQMVIDLTAGEDAINVENCVLSSPATCNIKAEDQENTNEAPKMEKQRGNQALALATQSVAAKVKGYHQQL